MPAVLFHLRWLDIWSLCGSHINFRIIISGFRKHSLFFFGWDHVYFFLVITQTILPIILIVKTQIHQHLISTWNDWNECFISLSSSIKMGKTLYMHWRWSGVWKFRYMTAVTFCLGSSRTQTGRNHGFKNWGRQKFRVTLQNQSSETAGLYGKGWSWNRG